MNDLINKIYSVRGVVFFLIFSAYFLNLATLIGKWDVFFGVMLGQFWSGQCVVSFLYNKRMHFSIGASLGENEDVSMRILVAFLSLSIFLFFFFLRDGLE